MLIKAFKTLFEQTEKSSEREQTNELALVAGALLYEVARADFEQSAAEESALAQALTSSFGLSREQLQTIQQQASEQADRATSLYEFTRIINDRASVEQKTELISLMWEVAYADGDLSKYEEHLIRRVSELIYVSHAEFIQGKHRAAQQANS